MLRPQKLFERPQTLLGLSFFISKMVPKVPCGCGSMSLKVPAHLCAQGQSPSEPYLALQLNMPRIKLILFTPKPAPSPNTSVLSTKSSFSCHPSLTPGGRASAVQNSDSLCRGKRGEAQRGSLAEVTANTEEEKAQGRVWGALLPQLPPLRSGPALPAGQARHGGRGVLTLH